MSISVNKVDVVSNQSNYEVNNASNGIEKDQQQLFQTHEDENSSMDTFRKFLGGMASSWVEPTLCTATIVESIVALNGATKGMRRGHGIAAAVLGVCSIVPLIFGK